MKPPTDPTSQSPQRAQKVKAKYTLWLNGFPDDTPNAKKVDSSKLGSFGFIAGVSQVIRGWDLTVLDMKVGEERRIVVPSSLGYGDRGAGGAIPAGATLYFDLELVEVGEMSKLGPEQLKWLEDNPL
jgi:FKBP-type peptidyl-prolyl cis-trans isomerase